MTKVHNPDHFQDFINKSASLSRVQHESNTHLFDSINEMAPISEKKVEGSCEKVHNYSQVRNQQTEKHNCSVDSLLSLSRNRSNFSQIFLDKGKKRKCQGQDKIKTKRLIRDILKNSKQSLLEGEKKDENGVQHSQSKSKKKDNGPPYRPTVIRTEDLFAPKIKKSDKLKNGKNLLKKTTNVMVQNTQGKAIRPQNMNGEIQDKGQTINDQSPENLVKTQQETMNKTQQKDTNTVNKGCICPSVEKQTQRSNNSEITPHQCHVRVPKEDLFQIYLHKNNEIKIEYINIEDEKEKEDVGLSYKLQDLENREKILEEKERRIKAQEELLRMRMKEEEAMKRKLRKIFTVKRQSPSHKKSCENNSLITSRTKHPVKDKKTLESQQRISREQAISRRLQHLQAMLQRHEKQLKKWCS